MRVKHSPASRRKKKKVLKSTRGYWGKRANVYRRAVETLRRAYVFAYRDRKVKKREFRALWITRVNAAARERGISYRELMHGLKRENIILSRNILAHLACEEPLAFDKIVEAVRKGTS